MIIRLKSVTRRVAQWLGFDIVRYSGEAWSRVQPFGEPATLIDVGVLKGTGELYESFPALRLEVGTWGDERAGRGSLVNA